MAKKHLPPPPGALDMEQIAAELASPDAEMRARAARSVCPCRMGWEAFEQCLEPVKQLQKDPSPQVRAAALHVFEDAFEMQSGGLPTSRQTITNEMAARKRRLRWGSLEEEAAPARDEAWRRERRRAGGRGAPRGPTAKK